MELVVVGCPGRCLVAFCRRRRWDLVNVDFGREVEDALDGGRRERFASQRVDVHDGGIIVLCASFLLFGNALCYVGDVLRWLLQHSSSPGSRKSGELES